MNDSTVIHRTYKGELPIEGERMERFSMHEMLMVNPDRYRAQLWQCVVTNWEGMKIVDLIVVTFRNNVPDPEWMRTCVDEGEMDPCVICVDDNEMFCMFTMDDPETQVWDDAIEF